MKIKKNNRILILLLLASIIGGLACSYLYELSPRNAININKFQQQLQGKEHKATATLEKMKDIIIHSSRDSLTNFHFGNDDISYYVYENNELTFWSDNALAINSIALPDSSGLHYIQLPNASCAGQVIEFDSYKLLALIKIKNNYPYENDELKNNFASGFDLNKEVTVAEGKPTDKLGVFSKEGNYLFTLSDPQIPIYNEIFSRIGMLVYSLAFLLFFILLTRAPYLLGRKTISLQTFFGIFAGLGISTGLCLYFNFPAVLFLNKLFSPFQYASNPFLASISHLTIATGFIIAIIYLFYFHTNTNLIKSKTGHQGLLILFFLYFILVYYVLSGIVNHSSIQLSILRFNDFSYINIWIHLLILVWGIGLALLFFKTHDWFYQNKQLKRAMLTDMVLTVLLFVLCFFKATDLSVKVTISFITICFIFYLPYRFRRNWNIYPSLAFWALVFTGFVIINSMTINKNKKMAKYKILAQNISINGNTDNDRMADILLEEMDIQIGKDYKLPRLFSNSDSLSSAASYLNANYLRGFWNKYEMRLNAAPLHSELHNEYDQFISTVGSRLKDTHFYSVPANENNMSYIGAFRLKPAGSDSIIFFMEFYPRRNFKSYSFPNLLIASAPDIQSKLNIGIAKYEHDKLVYASGKFDYPTRNNWISKGKTDFFRTVYKGNVHYIYAPNPTTYIIITEQQPYEILAYLLYFGYTALAYFAICCLLVWIHQLMNRKRNYILGMTSKFQYTFIGLLIISFLCIFYVSVNFIKQKYKDEQIENLESKKIYIQKALQDMYYWNQDLNALNTQALNFDLQDLSYIYHTDIHVYDNRGVLIGSSQPLIFNKNLISNRISPKVCFNPHASLNQYEHIGELSYLSGYTDFYNGDFLQIGYIAIPQFFSQKEIRNEIESFLTVIIHIYLIIIILAILLSLIIGKQLSAPLKMLENKLKSMHLGRRNEKIDYNLNDEIGQLVAQYNRTVDELEQSALMLAKSERESAWKSMARQVAHEINNPLTPMKLSIQQLQRTKKLNDERFDDYFEKSTAMLIEQIDNLSRIAGTFSNFARMPEAKFELVDIAARLYSVVRLFANNNELTQIEYIGPENNIFVYADPEQLVQVFNNLLKNAIQAIPDDREGKIEAKLIQDNGQIIIDISDNGIGIDKELSDKLFMPNFTTKNNGMGLGLAIAKNIIELTGGTISFYSTLNEGTTFRIVLPGENNIQ